MLRVLGCLTQQHDILMVAVSAAICMVSCVAAVALLARGGRCSGRWRGVWLGLAAMAFGGGVWATHFIAILAYDPGLPLGFDAVTTVASAVVAILLCGLGFTQGLAGEGAARRGAGGALAGLGVGAMHYLGMAALRLPGNLEYAPDLVGFSILGGAAFPTAALWLFRPDARWRRLGLCALLLLAGVVTVHFTGMGAVLVHPDGQIVVPGMALGHDWLAWLVGGAAAFLLLATLTALIVEARIAAAEALRMRGLADVAFEGIALCDGLTVVEANQALVTMLAAGGTCMAGKSLIEILDTEEGVAVPALLAAGEAAPVEVMLRVAGRAVPIELRVRRIHGRNGEVTVIGMRDLSERTAAEARIRYLAHHDALTGLSNRTMLRERLDHALAVARRTGQMVAVICLDLDRFKGVNDALGHAAGDTLLREVGRRVLAAVRDTDTVARLGGDEFVVVLPMVTQSHSVETLAERLTLSLSETYELGGGQQAAISASSGIALFPQDGEDGESLLANADLALYRVKQDGRNGYAFFQAEMDAEAQTRRRLEQDLRAALARGQLTLAFQPQADLQTGEVSGFEALLRWHHPERGQIPPDVFIPIAEASGAIVPIGAWVLREACAEAARWAVPLRIAVNVSPAQFQLCDMARLVEDTLATTGLEASRLELEVTEGLLIREPDRTLDLLRRIRATGVRIAMDDFGTGYSSLSSLRAFPFDRIKVDRSFVRDLATSPEAAAIVRAVLGLANGLGMPVVAEGVEDDAQLDALRGTDCAEIQGYLIGRPLPIGNFLDLTNPRQAVDLASAEGIALA